MEEQKELKKYEIKEEKISFEDFLKEDNFEKNYINLKEGKNKLYLDFNEIKKVEIHNNEENKTTTKINFYSYILEENKIDRKVLSLTPYQYAVLKRHFSKEFKDKGLVCRENFYYVEFFVETKNNRKEYKIIEVSCVPEEILEKFLNLKKVREQKESLEGSSVSLEQKNDKEDLDVEKIKVK